MDDHGSAIMPALRALGLQTEEQLVDCLRRLSAADLHRFRRFIDHLVIPTAEASSISVDPEGSPLRVMLTDRFGLPPERVRRILTFLDEYGALAASSGRKPTADELARDTEQSTATINRRLAEFRDVFLDEDPHALADRLRRALNDVSLWGSVHRSLDASIGDVLVVWGDP